MIQKSNLYQYELLYEHDFGPCVMGEAPRSVQEQLLYRNVQQFRGGLVFKAHRLLYHPTLGLRVIKREGELTACTSGCACGA